MRRLKIGIRTQLVTLVAFASLFSLLILGIVVGLYFSSNLSNLRGERLEVISQLKTSQVSQAVAYVYYQAYWLTNRDTISNPLTIYRAGNNSQSVFSEAQATLDQFVTSSDTFVAAKLYNLDLTVVADSINTISPVSAPAMDFLYPLQANVSVPSWLNVPDANLQSPSYWFTGPISNTTDTDSAYFVGMTFAIYANTSIILDKPSIAGYLSVIARASNIQLAVNDTSTDMGLNRSTSTRDYTVLAVRPVRNNPANGFNDSAEDEGALIGFQAVFPVSEDDLEPNRIYGINDSSAVKEALTVNYGSSTNKRSYSGTPVAIGFSEITLDYLTTWSIIVVQKRSVFERPNESLQRIIIGVVIGIGVFMCLVTFPLAMLFVKPITKLKNATEAITRSKREKDRDMMSEPSNGDPPPSPPPPPYYSIFRKLRRDKKEPQKQDESTTKDKTINKRNSVHSSGTGGSNSMYSTGIRLPTRIPDSKKIFKDELTELTEAFNIMREELEKQYTHLEDRVKLRTKELEASKIEAESANEAKTVFIANISHELRTPLNGILGMTSIAMDEHDQSRVKDSLKLIHRSGELLLHILTELLTYSKNTLNRSKLEKSSFQILEVVYQVQSIFSKLAIDQRVNFKISVKPNVLRKLILYGDSNRIIQVVMNLVSNSLKFTPVDGNVDVTFKLLGEFDAERSKEEKYEAVYVKNHQHPVMPHENLHPYDHEADKDVPKEKTDSSVSSKFDSNDDTISIATLSTSEYENVVFKQQFSMTKPLPGLPAQSPARTPRGFSPQRSPVEDAEPSDSPKATPTVSPRIEEVSRTDQPPTSDSLHPPEASNHVSNSNLAASPYLSTSPDLRQNTSSSKTLPTTPSASRLNRPSVSSMSSSINSHELVKNDKAFRIRHLYKPQSWVIQIEVSDTGSGIEPALQEKVFEPFIQGDQTLSRSYGGTGLGLSICKQLARMMKGTLTLKSTLGVGSTFTFTVPLPQVGSIDVPDEDMMEFCDDEFNPQSKVNRKVAFSTNKDEIINDIEEKEDKGECQDKFDENGLFKQPFVSSSPNDSPRDGADSSQATDSNSSNHDSYSESPTTHRFKLRPPSFVLEPSAPRKRSDDENSSDSNTCKRKGYFEKPHLITRGSTGTANSNEKSEATNHYLYDGLRHLKILVAEDNMVNQEVIKRMLRLEGLENITMACNGAEAVEYVKASIDNNSRFDLVFMDVQMPKIDGLAATKMIRSNLHYDRPIIALTAFADESNVKECLNSGMSGFLSKPIRRTNLRKIIVEFSPILLSDIVTTPQPHHDEDKQLGFERPE